MTRLAAVVIGRNEGERLVRCLASLKGKVARLIYVDSGSDDDSVAVAKAAGAEIIELSTDAPFTAARARAEGFNVLDNGEECIDFVQFIDGDCEIHPEWIAAGTKALAEDSRLGLVTGWRSEIHPKDSIYNALCDYEWHRPAGQITSCGGDMMVRVRAYRDAGGYRADVIAAEDDEFCLRLGKAGWKLVRIPVAMTRHDAAMARFSQWWQRAVRSGHGFAQVGALHPEFFIPERRRVWLYGGMLPLFALAAICLIPWMVLAILAIYSVSYMRAFQGVKRNGLGGFEAAHHAVFLTLSKFPNLIGMLTYHLRRARGADMRIIEYK